ncbi:MAG: L,D-transpeptidase family protein [Pseudomonadales bacterium]
MERSLASLIVILSCSALTAQATTSAEIRGFFEGLDAGAGPTIGSQSLHHPARLSTIYRDRDHQPIWNGNGPLSGQVDALLRAIDVSTSHGLNGGDYHHRALTALPGGDRQSLAFELLATDAFLRQVRHRVSGAVSPRDLDPDWHIVPDEIDPVSVLDRALAGDGNVFGLLDGLWPDSDDYRRLVERRARILSLGEIEILQVPGGPLLKPGQSGDRVRLLKDRLLGPDQHSDLFDAELKAAVVDFQTSAGLEPDGIVGAATLEVMNASRFSWIDRIDANLERWRWLPRHEPDTYVRVNIAAFSLRVIQSGEDALRMDVIVGRPYRRTPVFSETIKYLVFNPYWNVPFKLAVEDKLPDLKRDPAPLAALGFEVRPAGQDRFVPVTEFDWSEVTRGNFRHLLRQHPGPKNALGQMKFMLPNDHAVYLHDTPSRELFGKKERGFSSGCIRLSRPLELAKWILDYDGRPEQAQRVAAIVDGGETTTVYLRKPLPTYLVYFTAFTDDTGEVVFRRDLYQRDAAVVAALRAGSST